MTRNCESCFDEDWIYERHMDPFASEYRPGDRLCEGCFKKRQAWEPDAPTFDEALAKRADRG